MAASQVHLRACRGVWHVARCGRRNNAERLDDEGGADVYRGMSTTRVLCSVCSIPPPTGSRRRARLRRLLSLALRVRTSSSWHGAATVLYRCEPGRAGAARPAGERRGDARRRARARPARGGGRRGAPTASAPSPVLADAQTVRRGTAGVDGVKLLEESGCSRLGTCPGHGQR